MCVKRYIINFLIRCILHLKNLKYMFFIPIIIINIFLPTLSYFIYREYGISQKLFNDISEYSQWLLPLMSVWWPMLIIRDYLEGEGKEVLYMSKVKIKLFELFFVFLILMLNITFLFLIYIKILPDMKYEYIKVCIVCFLFFSIVYAIGFITKSTTITILGVILYTLINIFYGKTENKNFLIYFSTRKLSFDIFVSQYLMLLIISFALVMIGLVFNLKRKPI